MKKILFFVDDNYEDLELWYPKIRLEKAGYSTVIAAIHKNKEFRGKYGYPCNADIVVDEVNINEFAALVIPGGFSPDKLRRNKTVLEITAKIFNQNKSVVVDENLISSRIPKDLPEFLKSILKWLS